ncbi:sodium/potassium/calcium exchanger 1-like [Sinocyclocheilus rhinocerous]|uniref:sodium/potassium/calcium exchanger 1-like n=1 Tax=Sinocyclocheilus rhinocerous TaxID=307959 RepID=UPI0007B9241B|nr:PREDICTED: sodium/potassium/calcium exchanger 1-like [Sinocyclocheilus rhinocerous]
MGLCSHNGLLVMLLFHLCQAQDDALPSPDPEPAPPSLGEMIDAVKAAFEQAVQISTTGAVREALEQVVGELAPQKTQAEQSPAVETAADYTTEEAAKEEAVVLTAGEPDVLMSESSEQTSEQPGQEGLTQDIEPAEEIQGLAKSSISKSEEKSEEKSVELVLEAVDSVQEPVESVLQDADIAEVGAPMTEESHSEESPAQWYPDTQKENESGRGAVKMNKGSEEAEDEDVEDPEKGFTEKEAQLSEMEEKTAKGEIEKVEVSIEVKVQGPQEEESVKRQDTQWATESEHSQEEWQAVTAQMGTDGGVADMDEVEQEEEEQEVAKTQEGVIEVKARREEADSGSEAQLQKVSRQEEVPPTAKTEETPQEPEVAVDTKGPIKLQEPVIKKSKATGGKAHEASDVNEIITSRDPNKNNQGVPVLMNTVEQLPPTPVHKLRLGDTDAPMDSTQTKAIGQDTWKIGAIAAAFFLILQTAVTTVYILKCRTKPNSVAPQKLCARGNGGKEGDANNIDITVPIDEQTTVDNLPEYSQVQQEDVAMTTIPLDSTEKNSSYDPRTSVV